MQNINFEKIDRIALDVIVGLAGVSILTSNIFVPVSRLASPSERNIIMFFAVSCSLIWYYSILAILYFLFRKSEEA